MILDLNRYENTYARDNQNIIYYFCKCIMKLEFLRLLFDNDMIYVSSFFSVENTIGPKLFVLFRIYFMMEIKYNRDEVKLR